MAFEYSSRVPHLQLVKLNVRFVVLGKHLDSRQVWRLPRREGGEQSPDHIDVLRGPWRRHAKRDHFFALGKLGAHHFDNGFGKRLVCHLLLHGLTQASQAAPRAPPVAPIIGI
jgi:hypothetical protein